MNRPPPVPPRPELERRPKGPFGWSEAELLHDGWLAEIGPHAAATMVLLALATSTPSPVHLSSDNCPRPATASRKSSRCDSDGTSTRCSMSGMTTAPDGPPRPATILVTGNIVVEHHLYVGQQKSPAGTARGKRGRSS